MAHVRFRIIPRLDIKGEHLVKGVRMEGWRKLGDPAEFARRYYAEGVDELLLVDIVASLYGRNSLHDITERISRDVFIPVTVGGGIRTLDDIRQALRSGADKVAINTAAVERPEFIREAAEEFGRANIVVAIDFVRDEVMTHTGREHTGKDAIEWAQEAASLGAGELLLTSVDRDGTASGPYVYRGGVIQQVVKVPVVLGGGIENVEDVYDVAFMGRLSGVAIASWFHGTLKTQCDFGDLARYMRSKGVRCMCARAKERA